MSSDKAKETTVAGWLSTDQPDLFFEDNAVGRMKHELWQASDEVIDRSSRTTPSRPTSSGESLAAISRRHPVTR